MNNKIKMILAIGFLFIIGCVFWLAYPFLTFLFFATDSVPEDVAKSYMKEHYGIEIKVIEEESNALELGETWFTAVPKDNEEIKFTMVFSTNDHSLISENYRFAIQAQQEFKKLDTIWAEIDKLGFERAQEYGNDIAYFFHEDSRSLNLMPKEKIEAPPLKEEDLDRLYQLAILVLGSGAAFESVNVWSPETGGSTDAFDIRLDKVDRGMTKEAFLIMLKQSRSDLAAYEIQKEWEAEAEKIENERFQFNIEGFNEWVFCDVVKENGICLSPQMHLEYKEEGLKRGNPHLKKDLETIFNFVDNNSQPGMKVTIALSDEKNDVFISHEDRLSYKNTDELIKGLFPK